MNLNVSIPCGACTSCGREIREGEEAHVVVRAGSAWHDDYAELKTGAELFTATVECSDCFDDEAA